MSWCGLCLLELDDGFKEVWSLLHDPLDQQAGIALESLNVLFLLLQLLQQLLWCVCVWGGEPVSVYRNMGRSVC